MKTLRTILILWAVSILITGCGSRKSIQEIEIGCEEFNQHAFIEDSLILNSGDKISVKLCSNPSTGFQWSEISENVNTEILSQTSHDLLIQGDSGTPLPPGTPGFEIWTFTAQNTGQSQLYFEYSQNWEGGEKGIWTFTLDLTVQ